MNAILLPEGGSVRVFGMDTSTEDLLNIRRTVGMVFQNPDNQMVANVVEEDVAFAPENLGVLPDEIRRRVDAALAAVGMSEYREHAPHLLSGGQKAARRHCRRHRHAAALHRPRRADRHARPTGARRGSEHDRDAQPREGHHRGAHHAPHDRGRPRRARDRAARGRRLADGTPKEVFPQVELLQNAGLDVPATTRLLYELNRQGASLPLDALSTEECAQALCRWAKA